MPKVKSPQDLGAGILFLLIGLAGILLGRELDFGTARSMGPGFFPTIISGLIMALGLIVGARGLTLDGPAIERVQLRPLLMIIAALAVFGFLIKVIGVILTAILMIVIAAYAQPRVNIVQTLIFAVCMTAFIVLVFVYGLNQPMPLWWNS
jgi:hypothetical protein